MIKALCMLLWLSGCDVLHGNHTPVDDWMYAMGADQIHNGSGR